MEKDKIIQPDATEDAGTAAYRRYLEGDDGGMITIITGYRDPLIIFLSHCAADPADSEDLAQETFIKIATKRPAFRGKSSFKTWLFAIGRNLALDAERRKKKTVPISKMPDVADDVMSIEKNYICTERDRTLRDVMHKLSPEYRQVLWLVYFENLTDKETARIMKRSTHAIETLLCRARKALEDKLKKEGFVYEEL